MFSIFGIVMFSKLKIIFMPTSNQVALAQIDSLERIQSENGKYVLERNDDGTIIVYRDDKSKDQKTVTLTGLAPLGRTSERDMLPAARSIPTEKTSEQLLLQDSGSVVLQHDGGKLFLHADFAREINLSKLDTPAPYNTGVDILVGLSEFHVNNNLKRYYKDNDFRAVAYYGVEYHPSDHVVITEEEFNKTTEVDPFSVPALEDTKLWPLEGDIPATASAADRTTLASLISLRERGFKWAYRAVPGYPEGRHKIKLLELGTYPKATTDIHARFAMLCKSMEVIALGEKGWMKIRQHPDEPWVFRTRVELNFDIISTHSHLSDETRGKIDNVDQDMFSLTQLTLDLSSAGLSEDFTMDGFEQSELRSIIKDYFVERYLGRLRELGNPILSYQLVAKRERNVPEASLQPRHLRLVAHYNNVLNKRGATVQMPILYYACFVDNPSIRNYDKLDYQWLNTSAGKLAPGGIMAIHRRAFAKYLQGVLIHEVKKICYSVHPNVKDIDKSSIATGQTPEVTYNRTGNTLLTFTHENERQDKKDNLFGFGNTTMKFRSNSEVKVKVKGTTELELYCRYKFYIGYNGEFSSDIIDRVTTISYHLGIDHLGRVVLNRGNRTEDNHGKSMHEDSRWYDYLPFSYSGVNRALRNLIKDTVEGIVQNQVFQHFDIKLDALQGFIFPGGHDLTFDDLAFSDASDLVAAIRYADQS